MTDQAAGRTKLPDTFILDAQGGFAPMRPRDASTLLLLRRDRARIEVLAGRRSDQHKFMPGVYVFPGGRRDAGDSRTAVSGALAPEIEAKLAFRAGARMTSARKRALAVTAIRETWEEVGLMIGAPDAGSRPGSLPFIPAIGALRFIARAITPPGRTRRFDTRFFSLFADEADLDLSLIKAGDELERLEWVDLAAVGDLKMPNITRAILADVKGRLELSPQLSFESPVPFYYMRRGTFVREEF